MIFSAESSTTWAATSGFAHSARREWPSHVPQRDRIPAQHQRFVRPVVLPGRLQVQPLAMPCHTCTCQGGTPVQVPIPGCCLADSECGSPCQVCTDGQCMAGNDNETCGDCGVCSAGAYATGAKATHVCGDCNTCSTGYCVADDHLTCGECKVRNLAGSGSVMCVVAAHLLTTHASTEMLGG
jgi:hypothetical protein